MSSPRTVLSRDSTFRCPISFAPWRSPDAEARDPTAALGRDDDRQTVRLQDPHGGLSHVRLVRVREAAIEIGNLRAAAFRRLPRAEPLAEGGILVGGEGPVAGRSGAARRGATGRPFSSSAG